MFTLPQPCVLGIDVIWSGGNRDRIWENRQRNSFFNSSRGLVFKGPGPDPKFLDTSYFIDMVLALFNEAFRQHTGPFILEFQRSGLEADTFLRKLDQLVSHVSKDYEYMPSKCAIRRLSDLITGRSPPVFRPSWSSIRPWRRRQRPLYRAPSPDATRHQVP